MTYYAFVNPRSLCHEARCKLCRPWLKGRERLPAADRRRVQDDPRDEPHAAEQPQCPGDDHHDWCRCAVCSWWPDCYCGIPGCDGHRSDADLVQDVTRRTPDLRIPLAPLLRAA